MTCEQALPPHTIVTGGAGGIGAATIAALLERGHRVTSFDLVSHSDARVHSEIVDVTDEDVISAAVDRATEKAGLVTGMVACHGVRGDYVPASEMRLDSLRHLYDIHVVGTLAVCRQVVRRLGGAPASIVLISSTTAYGGWANQADYGTAKAAERQLGENLAIEWAPLGVRVNSIAPGHTMTPMVQSLIDADGYDIAQTEARTPLGRLARPEEMAAAIVWALCDATYMTGQCIPIDGGWTTPGK